MQLEWGSFLDRILHQLIDRVNISLVAVFEPSPFLVDFDFANLAPGCKRKIEFSIFISSESSGITYS